MISENLRKSLKSTLDMMHTKKTSTTHFLKRPKTPSKSERYICSNKYDDEKVELYRQLRDAECKGTSTDEIEMKYFLKF